MRLMKRVGAICLVVLFAIVNLGEYSCVQAEGNDGISLCYSYTSIIIAGLSIDGYGVAHCSGDLSAYANDATIKMTVRLWKKNDDGVWYVLKSWSKTDCADCTIEKDYSVDAGSYKVSVSATVTEPGVGSENVSKSTSVRTYGGG